MKSTGKSASNAKSKLKYRTWEHPAGSGIRVAEIPNKTAGKQYGWSYQVRVPAELTDGNRELHQRSSKEDAERLAEDRFVALKKLGTSFADVPAEVQRQVSVAWSILKGHNTANGTTLGILEVIKAGIRTLSPAGGRKTVSDVIAELTASKKARAEAGGLDGSTLHDFTVRSSRIADTFGPRFVSEIQHTEITEWLEKTRKTGAQFGGSLSARSVKNYRNTLSEIFRHATARQYCAENPFDRFTREDLKAHGGDGMARDLDGINILTIDEASRLLDAARESVEQGMLASVALRLFCGLRTTEVCRLDWSEVRWLDERPYVHIPAGKAKKRRIRHVDIPANALAWLRLCDAPASGPIIPTTGDAKKDTKAYCQRFSRMVKNAKLSDWENNDTRHSFASYHYALKGDAMATARLMGHAQNDDMLFAHYRTLVTKEQAEQFFALAPKAATSKVTTFPKAAVAG